MDEGPPTGSDVPWFDVEIAKLYREARRQVAPEKIIELGASQQAFLKKRDSCVGRSIDCWLGVHKQRVRELVGMMPGVASYREFSRPTVKGEMGDIGGGAMRVVTIGSKVDVALDASSAWGTGDNYCGFKAANLRRTESGTFAWEGKAPYRHADETIEPMCRVRFVPNGDGIDVQSDGCYETHFHCGNNAWISGLYKQRD